MEVSSHLNAPTPFFFQYKTSRHAFNRKQSNPQVFIFHFSDTLPLALPIIVAARSKLWVCVPSVSGIVGSNLGGGI